MKADRSINSVQPLNFTLALIPVTWHPRSAIKLNGRASTLTRSGMLKNVQNLRPIRMLVFRVINVSSLKGTMGKRRIIPLSKPVRILNTPIQTPNIRIKKTHHP